MVMRARDSVYHLSCFTCSTCNKTLTTGDHFGMKDSLVYCRAHFETLLQGEYPPQLSYTELAAKSGGLALPYFNGTGTVQKGRPRKRKSPALGVDIVNYNSDLAENLSRLTLRTGEIILLEGTLRTIWQPHSITTNAPDTKHGRPRARDPACFSLRFPRPGMMPDVAGQ
ncbi:LIM/homeobox protein Lhx9 [Saguinus oedipus]|uniref:LIM/homeobox protein Lhx9 n=1 Tax=Saguinus oedipus TaxID=9490 RepID=A0ABQ9TND3_SAGOE|nr:LIM/homeobox protein Lhx9 [Saguinus oedipus]